ncbi:hypothetical protein M422DRAFT_74810 [Sphaerobolus stellatus SS14]|nr:hypothetical protein M422DRAFT_74810 [Sphaerobolus stellatus SS14]
MHFSSFFTILFTLATSSLASSFTTTVSFDNTYDNAQGDLNTVSCSTGSNGLVTKGFSTFSSLPSFPRIGGADVIEGFNSANCGTCWSLEFNGNSINVLAIDHTASGFNIAQAALDQLTGGQAVQLGRITATATEVDPSQCGL